MVEFLKIGKGATPEVKKVQWEGLEKPAVFYFPGFGQIDKDVMNEDGLRSVGSFLKSVISDDIVSEDKLDIFYTRHPVPVGKSVMGMYTEFCDTVIKPIIESSEESSDRVKALKLAFSKITFVGYSKGSEMIDRVLKLSKKMLEDAGLSEEQVEEVLSSSMAISFGAAIEVEKVDRATRQVLFSTDSDLASPYERLPYGIESAGFDTHASIAHKKYDSSLMVISRDVAGERRLAKKVDDKHNSTFKDGYKNTKVVGNTYFEERFFSSGHDPYLYLNTTGEQPYDEIVTFQTNPSAHIIRDTITASARWSTYADRGIHRESDTIIEQISNKHLSRQGKEAASRLVEMSENARQAMMR